MSIENISMVINGLDVNIKNASPEQLVNVISALNSSNKPAIIEKKPQPKTVAVKSSHRAQTKSEIKRKKIRSDLSNHQIEKTPIFLSDYFPTEQKLSKAFSKATTHKITHLSLDSGQPFKGDSKQVVARQSIMFHLFRADNESKDVHELHDLLYKHSDLSKPTVGAVGNYLAQCSRLGILAKTTSGKGAKYHLSAWFLEQLEG